MAPTTAYDRLAEQKWFEETKAGVKGLADAGITELPRIFHAPPDSLNGAKPSASSADPDFTVPVIDLELGRVLQQDPEKRKQIVAEIRDATETWGFFQIVNHGVPANTIAEMKAGVHRFFDQDVGLKKEFFGRDITQKVVYTSNFDLYTAAAADWRDSIVYRMAPDPPAPEQLPACCRGIVMDYSAEMLKLGDLLFGLFSEALGLDPAHLKEMGCSEGLGIASHYYPACPQPDLTLGIARHSDLGFVTVLLQDHVGGLQVFRRDRWVDVPPTPGALVVNVGDMFQLISNDKFKSVEHRALVRSVGPRVSVAAFFGNEGLSTSRIYEPIKEFLSEDDPPKYHGITVRDFFFRSFQKGIDSSSILSRLMR